MLSNFANRQINTGITEPLAEVMTLGSVPLRDPVQAKVMVKVKGMAPYEQYSAMFTIKDNLLCPFVCLGWRSCCVICNYSDHKLCQSRIFAINSEDVQIRLQLPVNVFV